MFCKSPYDPCHFPKQFLNFQRGITQAYEVLGLWLHQCGCILCILCLVVSYTLTLSLLHVGVYAQSHAFACFSKGSDNMV